MYTLEQLQKKSLKELKEIGGQLNVLPTDDRRRRQSWIDALVNINPPLLQLLEASPGVEVEQAQEPPLESKFGRIVYPRPVQEAIVQVAKTSPGVDVDPVRRALKADITECNNRFRATSAGFYIPPRTYVTESVDGVEELLPKCAECFDDGFFEEESGFIKICHCRSEPKSSCQSVQSAIVPATKISESDQNPILTGICLSNRFLARYEPPQSESLHYELGDGYKADTDGQLSLFQAQVVTEPEPPDPDDFESLDDFREAIALWDAQNPEPPAVSLDSMCEWAPCPEEWYEPKAEILPLKASSMIELLEPSKVMEHLRTGDSSNTSDFFIPTFGAWCDRHQTGKDEPPDTGIFAYRPKPKPPNFPPQASWTQVGHKLDTSQPKSAQVSPSQASRNYPETIPKLFPRVAAGSSNQPARSPPGGDA